MQLGRIRFPDAHGNLPAPPARAGRELAVDTGDNAAPQGRFATLDEAVRALVAWGVRDPTALPPTPAQRRAPRPAAAPRPQPGAPPPRPTAAPPVRHGVVIERPGAPMRYELYRWGADGRIDDAPAVLDYAAPGTVALVAFNNGGDVYVPEVNGQRRWVRVPRTREFVALPAADVDAQRRDWLNRLPAASRNPAAGDRDASTPYLRRAVAATAASGLPIVRVNPRPATPTRKGSSYSGGVQLPSRVTVPLPAAREPFEPECYLRVITRAEGRMEAINAYDYGAGASIGPIQINLVQGRIFQFLDRLWENDPALFRREFQRTGPAERLHWMRLAGVATPLRVRSPRVGRNCTPLAGAATVADLLAASRGAAAAEVNEGYFQLGRVCAPHPRPKETRFRGQSHVDAGFRVLIAERLRNVVAWPHVHDLIVSSCVAYLQPGLNQLHGPRAQLPALRLADVTRDAPNAAGRMRQRPPQPARRATAPAPPDPTRDLFVLKAVLLSAYVRWSAALVGGRRKKRQGPGLLAALPSADTTGKLRDLQRLCTQRAQFQSAVGFLTTTAGDELRTRLTAQLRVAPGVYTSLQTMARALRET